MLTESLPDSFFPGPMPFGTKDGYTVYVYASVQVCQPACSGERGEGGEGQGGGAREACVFVCDTSACMCAFTHVI